MRTLSAEVSAPAELGVEPIGVSEGAPLELDLRFESVVEGVFVSGTVSARAGGECVRCLRPVATDVVASIAELFAYPDSLTEETTDEDEVRRIEDEKIDLEPAIRDMVVLALPLAPVCREDCPGLCATCGERLEDLPADHTHETIDPRWSALSEWATTDASSPDGRPENADESPAGGRPDSQEK
ncbi:MAG TPA: YceD family protein [Mycobacteriales bacterium]|nr:YceD family protein [Mycobacteriales bacterium]